MIPKARIFELCVDQFPGHAEEIYTHLKKKYDVKYVCFFTRSAEQYIGVQFVNRVLMNKVTEMVTSHGLYVKSTRICKRFIGQQSSEHGIRNPQGGSRPGCRKRRIQDDTPPNPPRTEKESSRRPPKGLPGIPEIEDYENDFLAVWGSDRLGHWYPIGYVGPEKSIRPGRRRSVPQVEIDRLFAEQDSGCASCGCDVFMGKLSNADVDHVIPLRLGGSCCVDNLQVLCVTCHRRKTALECKKIRCNVVVYHLIRL